MPGKSEELLFSFLTLKLLARGRVALVMAASVSLFILAVAWRLVK